MEKRDAGAGETVKREKGEGVAGLEGAAGAVGVASAGSPAGACGTPWSHWNLAPAKRREVTEFRGLQVSFAALGAASPTPQVPVRRVAPRRPAPPPRPLRENEGPGHVLEAPPRNVAPPTLKTQVPGPALEAPPTTPPRRWKAPPPTHPLGP